MYLIVQFTEKQKKHKLYFAAVNICTHSLLGVPLRYRSAIHLWQRYHVFLLS